MRDRIPIKGRVNVIMLVDNQPYVHDEAWARRQKLFGRPINRPLLPRCELAARRLIEKALPGITGTYTNIGRPSEGRFVVEQFVLFTPDTEVKELRHFELVDKSLRFGERILSLLEAQQLLSAAA